jgi:ABC-2 type transport system ATP-binding protein
LQVLVLEEATKDYGLRKIGPISFSIESGEIVGLLGPNGSGKSTTIRMALGLASPTSGLVRLMGFDPIKYHSRALKGVGYSPELPNLQTFMTPREFLTLIAKEIGLKEGEIKKHVELVLEEVGLPRYADVRIGKLSKGMVQRLSIAQAIIGEPTFLILDEPMIGIDPAGVLHFRSLFQRLSKENKTTVLLSSHVMSEVESICSKVALMHSGKLLYYGPLEGFVKKAVKSRKINVELSSYPEGIISSIRNVNGVISVTLRDSHLTVETDPSIDVRAEISRLVVNSGLDLLSIGYARDELGEAFRSMIRRGEY